MDDELNKWIKKWGDVLDRDKTQGTQQTPPDGAQQQQGTQPPEENPVPDPEPTAVDKDVDAGQE